VVALLLCSLIGRSQIFQYPNPGAYGQGMHRFVPDSVLYVPTGCGAPSGIASLNSYGFTGFGQKIRQAALYADTCGHKVYWFDWTDSSWNEFGGGGLSPSDTTGKWFSWGYRSHDSVYFCKNTTCTFIYKDSVGSGGTDSAIAALYGLKEIVSGTTRYFYVDSFAVESRQRGLKIADSLAVVFNASLALKKDKSDSAINSASYTSRGWLYHVIDSLSGITDFTDYHSTGATGIPLLVVSTSGSHTGVNIPKIRDSTVTIIAGDSGVTIATHDSISANALQTKYRTDTMRNRIDTSLDNKMKNYGGAPGQLQGLAASIPSAASYPAGTTYLATDTKVLYRNNGSSWDAIGGGGGLPSSLNTGHIFMGDNSGTAKDTTLIQDQPSNGILPIPLSETKMLAFAEGTNASSSATNYSYSSVDSVLYRFSTTRAGVSPSTEYGGWLANSTSGDSLQIWTPLGVVFGDSQAEGHPNLHGPLHWLLAGVPQNTYNYAYPDSPGTLSWHLRLRTNYPWLNMGIGGQTSTQCLQRMYRDVLAMTSNPNDGRGTKTMSHRPVVAVIIAGINDFNGGISPETTVSNLEEMAALCQAYGIKAVFLNLPGDAINSQGMLRQIAYVNGKLRQGVLSPYNAAVVDYNAWWNDSTYKTDVGYDNIHHTSLIFDDIHPSKVGYDSLSAYIMRQGNIPILTKMVFINELDPSGFSGYSRPHDITIASVPYTITKSTDTISITSPLPSDSIWVKVISSTNVTGTSYSGFSSILYYLENNPNNYVYYTKRGHYQGGRKIEPVLTALNIKAPDFNAGRSIFSLNFADGTPIMNIRAGTGSSTLYTGNDTITGSLVVNGSIIPIRASATSIGNILGNFQIGNTTAATQTGYGMGLVNSAVRFDATGGFANNDAYLFSYWATAGNVTSSNGNSNALRLAYNYGNLTGIKDTISQLRLNPTINNTNTTSQGNTINGIVYSPIVSNQGGAGLVGFKNTIGNNYWNTQGGRTVIGSEGSSNWNGALEINSTKRGFLPPSMTTAQRDSMGCVSSVVITGGSWTVAPVLTLTTPGIGTGAVVNCYISSGTSLSADVVEGGYNYVPGTAVTGAFSGGTGSGGTITVNVSGPRNGMIIYNSTIDSLQLKTPSGWVDLGTAVFGAHIAPYTVSAGTNVSAVTAGDMRYTIVDSIVTVNVRGSWDVTTAGSSSTINITLPVTCSSYPSGEGSYVGSGAWYSAGSTDIVPIIALMNSSTNVQLVCKPPVTSSTAFNATFIYHQ
jgi:hypothetical protein